MVSERSRTIWAKSVTDEVYHSEVIEWLPLYQHLDDSWRIAAKLWDHWVPDSVRRLIAEPYGGDLELAKTLYLFLAGTHDVGKASPAFAVQVPVLADRMIRAGLPLDTNIAGTTERALARHELVSYFALADWLEDKFPERIDTARLLATVVGAHHGNAPKSLVLREIRFRDDLLGGGAWAQARRELLTRIAEHTGFGSRGEALLAQAPTQTGLILLSGLVIMADWIASNQQYFPLFPIAAHGADLTPPTSDSWQRADLAWAALEFPERWRAPEKQAERDFAEQFGLPPGSEPNAVQAAVFDIARASTGPRLLILEAGMGTGKTEAALGAAEILARRTGAGGLFIGLPTQATTDGMFPRVLAWAENLDRRSTVFLAHSKSELNEPNSGLTRRAFARRRIVGNGEIVAASGSAVTDARRSEEVISHAWLSDRKRGPLASLVVGTIDQALFTSLNSRHLMLRHLALAGKVVVIDEAHAYSTFMNRYLDRALEWFGAYGTSVIILSATLPAERRVQMLESYDTGRRRAAGIRLSRAEKKIDRYARLRGDIGYPSVIATDGDNEPVLVLPRVEPSAADREVLIEWIADSGAAVVESLRTALGEGGCAVVIRNTVGRVQETARILRAAFPDTRVIVAHSRFLASDRAARDRLLLDLFGPAHRAGTRRPESCIVVASQVVEQSLDIDFDVMISDLAPIDLLFQRAGRLHRHERGTGQGERPAPLRQPRLILTGVDRDHTPPEPNSAFSRIYRRLIQLRTLAVLEGRASVRLPEDISPLVQAVYSLEPLLPEPWEAAGEAARRAFDAELDTAQSRAEHFLLREPEGPGEGLLDWAPRGIGSLGEEETARASVRDSAESLEVLVLFRDIEGTLMTPPWALKGGGIPIPLDAPPEPDLARKILGHSLRLPPRLCLPHEIDGHIAELERRMDLPHWQISRELRGELVLEFDHEHRARIGGYTLIYDVNDGLELIDDRPGR